MAQGVLRSPIWFSKWRVRTTNFARTSSGPGSLGVASASAAFVFAVFLFEVGEASRGAGVFCV